MYFNGRVVPQDYVEAHKWYNLAASRATGDAQDGFAELRDELAEQMTPRPGRRGAAAGEGVASGL